MLITVYSVAETDDVCMVVKWRGRKDNRSSILILLVCICYLLATVWQRQMMCGSEVERKKRQQEFNSTTLILLVCICHLPATVWQRQTMYGSEVERKNIQQEFDSTTLILFVCICYHLQCGRDR